MSRYIDADELVKILSYMRSHHKVDIFGRHFLDCYRAGEEYLETMDDVIESVCRMPAADVVEVVRCRDCKWFDDIGCAIRIVDDSDRPSENDFCSFAERKDNG